MANDFAVSMRWRAYIADFETRLANSVGLIPWTSTTSTGDSVRDANWKLMTADWVLPIMSIIFAKNGAVSAIFDYPLETSFRPIDPGNVSALPKLRGVDYERYKQALSSKSGLFENENPRLTQHAQAR